MYNHHDRMYDDVLATGTTYIDDDSMALYLDCYDRGYTHRSQGLDLWIALFWCSTFVYGHMSHVTHFV